MYGDSLVVTMRRDGLASHVALATRLVACFLFGRSVLLRLPVQCHCKTIHHQLSIRQFDLLGYIYYQHCYQYVHYCEQAAQGVNI